MKRNSRGDEKTMDIDEQSLTYSGLTEMVTKTGQATLLARTRAGEAQMQAEMAMAAASSALDASKLAREAAVAAEAAMNKTVMMYTVQSINSACPGPSGSSEEEPEEDQVRQLSRDPVAAPKKSQKKSSDDAKSSKSQKKTR